MRQMRTLEHRLKCDLSGGGGISLRLLPGSRPLCPLPQPWIVGPFAHFHDFDAAHVGVKRIDQNILLLGNERRRNYEEERSLGPRPISSVPDARASCRLSVPTNELRRVDLF